jgi:hypothetical protein
MKAAKAVNSKVSDDRERFVKQESQIRSPSVYVESVNKSLGVTLDVRISPGHVHGSKPGNNALGAGVPAARQGQAQQD